MFCCRVILKQTWCEWCGGNQETKISDNVTNISNLEDCLVFSVLQPDPPPPLHQVKRFCYSSYFCRSTNIFQTINYQITIITYLLHTLLRHVYFSHDMGWRSSVIIAHFVGHLLDNLPNGSDICHVAYTWNHTERRRDRNHSLEGFRRTDYWGFIANQLRAVWSLVTQVAVCTCLVWCSGGQWLFRAPSQLFPHILWSGWLLEGHPCAAINYCYSCLTVITNPHLFLT